MDLNGTACKMYSRYREAQSGRICCLEYEALTLLCASKTGRVSSKSILECSRIAVPLLTEPKRVLLRNLGATNNLRGAGQFRVAGSSYQSTRIGQMSHQQYMHSSFSFKGTPGAMGRLWIWSHGSHKNDPATSRAAPGFQGHPISKHGFQLSTGLSDFTFGDRAITIVTKRSLHMSEGEGSGIVDKLRLGGIVKHRLTFFVAYFW
ncbi:hypothetical protein BDQ94DRAFT_163342 [Aspergillus welwitschiae]|uniref:Uncharacterized protein n=1 Tax=Aspergillus welwitschiae TaxID=1341132 RepID=A0A3F3PLF0_9EURO|nr:hypothetical protein BDQ94DRAFT_163342 [Aspergillus welwitschiae]RDH27760.1 hypothetical protein BDQ94DRAFT_163342 [Aspergillus welwitschiae]